MARKLTAAEESECAIYAEGTNYTPDDVKRLYREHIGNERQSFALDVQDFCETVLHIGSKDVPPVFVIDHDRFGDRQAFDSIGEAQSALRECGDEFAGVTLTVRGASIIDERGDVVGSVSQCH